MIAIDKAWKENLKLNKEDQFESKQNLIDEMCINSYDINLKNIGNSDKACKLFDEDCESCWNCEIEEDAIHNIEEITKEEVKESKFEQLYQSPIEGIKLDDENEQETIISLKDNSEIIWTGLESQITYDNIPQLIKWLQDVYDYCTELKENNMIEYVDFNTAKEYMYNSGIAECEGVLYDSSSIFTLDVIDSDKWILIKVE